MLENILTNTTILWLIATIVFAIIEALTAGLVTIWFAGGSLAALAVSFFTDNIWIETILFLIVSICLLVFTRKIFVQKLKTGNTKTNIEALIGKEVIVVKTIEPFNTGQVRINDIEWKAENIHKNDIIEAGKHVVIRGVEGVKVIVEVI